MLLWLFKQLARGSYRDRLLIETPRLAKLGCGWERQIGLLPRVQMQPKSQPPPPHPTPYTIIPSLLLNRLVINTQTWCIAAQWNKCIVTQTFMSKDWSLQKEKDVKKCEMKPCDLFTALSPPCVTPRMVTRAWRLHRRSNEERAEEGR